MQRFLSFIAFLPFSFYAQQTIVGTIAEHKSDNRIEDVYVFMGNTLVAKTNNEGVFILDFPKIQKGTAFTFKRVNYEDKTVTINSYWYKRIYNDTLFISIQLKPTNNELPDVLIFAERKPDTVFGSPVYSVEDFLLVDSTMLLLAYEQTLRKGASLLLVDYEQNVLLKHPLNFYATNVFTDYSGKHYVYGDEQYYRINIHNTHLYLEKIEADIFLDFTQRVIDSVHQKYYFSNYQDIYPAFSFFSWANEDSTAKEIHKVEDAFMMELYRSEYKYVPPQEKLWARRQEQKTGIDKEIWIGAVYFTQSLYYKPAYAPMTIFADTAYIFDHYSDKLFKLDTRTDKKTDSIAINYHHVMRKDKWKQPLLFDDAQHEAYALFENTGNLYLRTIDVNSGKISSTFKLHYRYVETIKVHKGYVYYIYRPFESLQKKFIYRERIRKS
ncbi:MAG: hypothetical protein ACLGGV_01345 [Bacteroidia bacterium]